jgi:hypothetical protein
MDVGLAASPLWSKNDSEEIRAVARILSQVSCKRTRIYKTNTGGEMSNYYKHEYKLVRWHSPEDFCAQLQELNNAGWHSDLSRIYHEKGDSGWTIFSRSFDAKPEFLRFEIDYSALYKIINSREFMDATREFDETSWPYQTKAGNVLDQKLKEHYDRYVARFVEEGR